MCCTATIRTGNGSSGSSATTGRSTTLGRYGKPGPKYVAYVDAGPPDKRVIAQLNHDLDVVHDVAPEGMFTLAKQSKTLKTWFKGFPYRTSRSDAAVRHLQPAKSAVPEPGCALGAALC